MKIELDSDFSAEEISLLNMHSVCNVLNVVQFELERLDAHIGSSPEIRNLINAIQNVTEDLKNPDKAIGHIRSIENFTSLVERTLETSIPEGQRNDQEVIAVRSNLEGIFGILLIRAKEIDDRWDNPMAWVEHNSEELRNNFVQVFRAIEENSHGAYHIVFNLAAHEDGDYMVNLEIDTKGDQPLLMPLVFQDVMRDLLANARKYSPPGETISAGLYLDDDYLRFVVHDEGMGIPEDEVEQVVKFGYRAENVKHRKTMGGGFGLSKAFYIAKLFKGSMEINSPLKEGRGTRISIRLPRP